MAARPDTAVTRFRVTAGSSLTWGNARSIAFNLGGNFELKRDIHALLLEIGWVYGLQSLRTDVPMMAPPTYSPLTESSNNLTWRARYDLFITPEDAAFLVHRGRRDTFAGLEPRIGFQIGYMRNILREERHRFWGELGYDFTYDRFTDAIVAAMTTMPPQRDRILHSLRVFLGYETLLNDLLTYRTGFELLMNFELPEHLRMEWTNQLRSKIETWLEIALDWTLRVDARPPGQAIAWNDGSGTGVQMVDFLTTLNLVGTLDLEARPPAPPEPEPEPECPACECASATPAEPAEGAEGGGTEGGEPAAEPAPEGEPAPAPDGVPAPAP
ncbi:MAG: DUF481 domain-containing protein [Sandaracinaceae bacterium]|nr:DUF481 domain-containing protein [Sandaracinaceae bacterium]